MAYEKEIGKGEVRGSETQENLSIAESYAWLFTLSFSALLERTTPSSSMNLPLSS